MKKHMPGFVPIKFNKAGIAVLVIGAACLVAKTVFNLSDFLIYLGVGFLFLSFYLIFVEPEE